MPELKTPPLAPAPDLKTPEGLRTKREQLVAELQQTSQLAQAHAAKARECEQRAVFLNGAIAMLNDQLGDVPAAAAAPVVSLVPTNRATRRRAAKARAA